MYFVNAFITQRLRQGGIVYLLFKTIEGNISWSDSRRVDCEMCNVHSSNPYSMITLCHIGGWHSSSFI